VEATDSPEVAPDRAARADHGGHALASTTIDARTRAATTMTDGLPVADDGMTTRSSATRAKTKRPSVAPALRLRTLSRGSRKPAIPVLRESFHGDYRWHAKRALRDIERVRAAYRGRELVGISMVELLRPTIGYVNYLAIAPSRRGEGIGASYSTTRWPTSFASVRASCSPPRKRRSEPRSVCGGPEGFA
jgi:hypothetical protein